MKNRLLTIVLAFLPLMSWGQGTTDPQPYARLAEDGNNNLVLTFYYNLDKNDSDFGIGPFTSASDRGWHSSRANIKEVVFDESFASYDGLSNMNMWFYQMSGLTKITGISNLNTANVTSLRSTFNGCSSLTTLDLSSLNTSEVKEMNFMFEGCSSLTDLKVGFSTENVTTMANMFLGCSSLTTLDLSTFNTANVKSNMDYMFSSCSALTTIYVSDLWTTENVTSGNEMFNACQSLVGGQGTTFSTSHRGLDYAHIDGGTANPGYFTNGTAIIEFADAKVKEICINNWDTNGDGELSTVEAAAVTSLGKKFSGTTITSFDELQYFRGLTYLDEGEFSNCPNLASVIVPEGVTSIGYYGFHGCPLASVTLPSTLTSIGGGAFEGCEKLTSITIPVGVTELSRRVLCGCSSLTSIVLPTSLTTIGESALEGCVSLHEIDIPESVTELGPNAINNTGLTSVTIPAGVTSISERAFMNSAALTSVTSQIVNPYAIPDDVFSEYVYQNAPLFVPTGSVDAYKNTDGWKQFMYILAIGDTLRLPYAVLTENNTVLTFYYDEKKADHNGMDVGTFEYLESVAWKDYRESISSVVFDSKFVNCTSLSSVANWFAYCSNLTTITGLEYLKTDNVTDMNHMFYRCSSLTGLDLSGFNTEKVSNMNSLFEGCSGLTSLDLSAFNTANVTNMSWMFEGCSSLTSLDVSGFNTANVTDMRHMFWGCSGLKTIYVGDNWSTASVTDGSEMFSGCTNLVGGKGTVYNPDHVDATYAHIDEGTSNPGYFTLSGDGPYVPVDVTFDNHGVLTVGGTATMAEALEAVGGVSAVAETVTAIVWNSTATLTNSDLQDLDNPNMLVYVPSVSQAPVNRDNVIIGNDGTGYTAKNIVLTDVESGNQNFYCPKAFVAEMITYAHDYLQQTEVGVSRGWETIALPFTVQTIMHEKQGVIAPFGNDASNKHFWLRQLMMQGLTRATVIEANMPYLIAMPNSDAYAAEFNLNGHVTFSSQNVEVPQTQMNVMEAHDANDNMMMFVPCFQAQPQGQEIYALNVGEQRDNHPEGSVFEANYREVRPFEAFTVHNGNGPAPRFVLISEMMGGATEIESLTPALSEGEGAWYTIDGRRLQKKPTRKGVYLNNGRKVVVQK